MARSRLYKVTRGTLRLLSRPVRRAQGRGGIVLEPYRGYGSRDEIFLIGRVFRQSRPDPGADRDSLRDLWRDVRRRIARRAVKDAAVTARFGGTEQRVATDRDGYFRVHLEPRAMPVCDGPWHAVDLTLDADPPVEARGDIYVPPPRARFAVISDIDDTVMHTGVANKLVMLWRLFVEDAESRVAFPGVAMLYRALHDGAGAEHNPMLYVSRAPWGLYDVLSEFFARHAIPAGPVLFLREWGLSWTHPLPRRAEDHKRILIGNMLALYRDLPFVLIGDSGQHDPEVYAEVVAEHPGRVRAIYIRNVSADAARIAEIERIAARVTEAGASFVLAADSVAMAEHAAGLGLIAPDAVATVRAEREAAPPEPATGPLPGMLRPAEAPPTVVIDPEGGRRL
jgi:phosphatidate phosphatase APP1